MAVSGSYLVIVWSYLTINVFYTTTTTVTSVTTGTIVTDMENVIGVPSAAHAIFLGWGKRLRLDIHFLVQCALAVIFFL